MDNNQYPSLFYDPIIEKTISKIVANFKNQKEKDDDKEEKERNLFFIQYRGRVTDKFENSLRNIKAHFKFISIIKKTKSCLPSLKCSIEKGLKAG